MNPSTPESNLNPIMAHLFWVLSSLPIIVGKIILVSTKKVRSINMNCHASFWVRSLLQLSFISFSRKKWYTRWKHLSHSVYTFTCLFAHKYNGKRVLFQCHAHMKHINEQNMINRNNNWRWQQFNINISHRTVWYNWKRKMNRRKASCKISECCTHSILGDSLEIHLQNSPSTLPC